VPDIVCLGEALIDMVSAQPGMGLVPSTVFEKAAGGAVTNVAAGAAILGAQSGLIAKVGKDHFGEFLRQSLFDAGVDLDHFLMTPEYATQLAFVAVSPEGVPDFSFHVKRSADQMLEVAELRADYIESAQIFHFGSISLIDEPSRAATLHALEIAGDAGLLISYDPNLRPPLWPSLDVAHEWICEGVTYCDVIKVSEQELEFITGLDVPHRAMQAIWDMGPELVAVTRGPNGCWFFDGEEVGEVPGFEVPVDETTGCGDAFTAALLVQLLESEEDVSEITFDQLLEVFRFANAAGALTATGHGAIPSLPSREEVLELLGLSTDEEE
jgi:fructokinase